MAFFTFLTIFLWLLAHSVQGNFSSLTRITFNVQYFLIIYLNIYIFSLTDSSLPQAKVTQSPSEKNIEAGQSVTLTCSSNLDVGKWCNDRYCHSWYLIKAGETPKLLIYQGNLRHSSAPSRFSGNGSIKSSQLTISGARGEDSGLYFCFGDYGGHRFTQ